MPSRERDLLREVLGNCDVAVEYGAANAKYAEPQIDRSTIEEIRALLAEPEEPYLPGVLGDSEIGGEVHTARLRPWTRADIEALVAKVSAFEQPNTIWVGYTKPDLIAALCKAAGVEGKND